MPCLHLRFFEGLTSDAPATGSKRPFRGNADCPSRAEAVPPECTHKSWLPASWGPPQRGSPGTLAGSPVSPPWACPLLPEHQVDLRVSAQPDTNAKPRAEVPLPGQGSGLMRRQRLQPCDPPRGPLPTAPRRLSDTGPPALAQSTRPPPPRASRDRAADPKPSGRLRPLCSPSQHPRATGASGPEACTPHQSQPQP